MLNKSLIAFTILTNALSSQAQTTKQTWINPECANGPCDIVSMKLTVSKLISNELAGNDMTAEIQGSSKEVLSKYAFVQYLRGCVFAENSAGKKQYAFREFMGKDNQIFKHPNWVIDSAGDKDPIYWSNANAGFDELRGIFIPRNSLYLNRSEGGSWAGKTSNLAEAKIYASDLPSMTQVNFQDVSWTAQNTSLEFKICLHKIEDVAAKVDNPEYVAPNPITCMEWSSNYNFEKFSRKIVEKKAINPFCLN